MNEQGHWNLMAKYLFGECTEEEEAYVQVWLEVEPERKRWLAELKEALHATKRPPAERDVDANWERLEHYIEEEGPEVKFADQRANEAQPFPPSAPSGAVSDATGRGPARDGRPSRRRRKRSVTRRIVRVAAPVVVAICAVLIVLWGGGERGPSSGTEGEARVFATERGERATVRLADGTLVRLNAASSITLSPSFGEERREVRLEGEGYFEVAGDTSRPFVVRSGRATTRVLGTEFNVGAYPDDDRIEVVVAEGKVAFDAEPSSGNEAGEDGQGVHDDQGDIYESKTPSEGVVLTARQMATLRASGRVVRGSADLERHLAWIEGDLYFKDAPFSEVARKLERWYDLEVELVNASTPDGHLNARFSEEQALDKVLDVIATIFRMEYERKQRRVIFTLTEDAHSP